MWTYVTHYEWMEGPHAGKVRTSIGGPAYDTPESAISWGQHYNPIGHIYVHGTSGHRCRVTKVTAKRLKGA